MEKTAITALLHQLAEGDAALEALLSQALTRALGKQDTAPDRGKLRHICDWLKAALVSQDGWLRDKNRAGVPVRLAQISTIEAAYNAADKDMKRAANKLRSQFAGAAAHFEADEAAGHIKTVHIFEDGSRMVQLLTPHALDFESAQLGHCIGHGSYDGDLGKSGHAHYSYRDPLNRAHATLEVVDGVLEQCKGKENAPPLERYFKPIQDFIRLNKWKLTEDVTYTGLLEKDGTYYDVANLPDGFVWDGNMNLSGARWLKRLPARLRVLKVMRLVACTGLTMLPDGLHVGGDIWLNFCTGLISLPDNLHVDGYLCLEGCVRLMHIGDNLKVRQNLRLDDCKELRALPDNLHVGSNLYLNGCTKLRKLPKNMTVKGLVFWNRKVYKTVAEFRAAFEAMHPPQNENRAHKPPVPKVA